MGLDQYLPGAHPPIRRAGLPHLPGRPYILAVPTELLEAARRVVFLVAGAEKASILREVLCERGDPPLPAQMVKPREGERLFFVDEAAAAKISASRSQPIREGKS